MEKYKRDCARDRERGHVEKKVLCLSLSPPVNLTGPHNL